MQVLKGENAPGNENSPHFAQALKTAANFAVEGVEDLVLLPKVTAEGITDNIKKRYLLDKIYVRHMLC